MLEMRNISKALGGRQILNGLDLRIEKGQTLVIVGASGTGKSVTLQHMIGLMKPDQGQVLVDGEELQQARGRKLEKLRLKFGVLFQSGALINWMSIADNVALPLIEKTTLSDSQIEQIVAEKLAMVDLDGAGEKMPSEVSGGMKKRAGLARAIVHNPQIVLYDEPTSGLDPVMSRKIDALIRNLQAKLGITSVVVTHDLLSAFNVGDVIVMLHEGRVIEQGTPNVFAASQLPIVREFIDSQFAGEKYWENKV
jgi:phospholipid/cholesterol/gamma-HCH transport system ATP-binding protein